MSNDSTDGLIVKSAGAQERIVEDAVEHGVVRPSRGLADDFAGAADAAVDKVADCEAHVRFESRHPVAMQAVAERRCVLRYADVHPQRGFAGEGGVRRLHLAGRTECPRQGGVASPNVETRHLAAVAHEKRAAVLEHSIEVDDGNTIVDAVAGLQDEAAYRLVRGRILAGYDAHRLPGRAAHLDEPVDHRHMCVPPQTAMAWPVT